MMKKNDMYFYRWGNLNAIKHKEARGVDEDEWMHVAPVYKGIYAFPRGYVETFLISGTFTQHILHKVTDELGNDVDESQFYEKDWKTPIKKFRTYIKKRHIKLREITSKQTPIPGEVDEDGDPNYRFPIYYRTRPKKFKYTGDLWHHLGDYCNEKDIIDRKHGWVKTSYKVWLTALHKCHTKERFDSYMYKNKYSICCNGNPHTCPSFYTKDHYEVFIEHLK